MHTLLNTLDWVSWILAWLAIAYSAIYLVVTIVHDLLCYTETGRFHKALGDLERAGQGQYPDHLFDLGLMVQFSMPGVLGLVWVISRSWSGG